MQIQILKYISATKVTEFAIYFYLISCEKFIASKLVYDTAVVTYGMSVHDIALVDIKCSFEIFIHDHVI